MLTGYDADKRRYKSTDLVPKRPRVADNASLYTACQAHDRVIAYYNLDPSWFEMTPLGFGAQNVTVPVLLESLHDLQAELAQYHISLVVRAA